MRWRLVAVAGSSAALAACDFNDAFRKYCENPGRCAMVDDGGAPPTKIAQGTQGRIVTLTGVHLADAKAVTTVPDVGTVSGVTSTDTEISGVLDLNHGVPEGNRFQLRVVWDQERAGLEHQDSNPFVVTAIHVANGGNDADAGVGTDAGDGTDDRPYATLAFAGQKSGPGDTIRLGPGQFGTIFPDPTTPCEDGGFTLAPGLTVEGAVGADGGSATSIVGTGDPGTCAFNLFSTDQVVQDVNISAFTTGILSTGAVSTGGSRPRVTNVKIASCDAGVVVMPGSSLLLQQVDISNSETGLISVAGDVRFEVGSVANSSTNGVLQTGDGGSLVLSLVEVRDNAASFSTGSCFLSGAGVLLAGQGASAVIDGGLIQDNGCTDVTVGGTDNAVSFIETTMLGLNQDYGLALMGAANNASITMLRSTLRRLKTTGLYAEGFGAFNGGDADGGGGNYIYLSPTQIHDFRGSPGPRMTFRNTQIGTTTPAPQTLIDSSNAGTYGVVFDNSSNKIECY